MTTTFGPDNSVSAERATQKPAEPTIWFEVGEFLEYFHWAKSPTGIQRVQIELFAEADRRGLVPGRIRFCRLDRYTHRFMPVDFAAVAACFEEPPPSGGRSLFPRARTLISQIRADSRVWRGSIRGWLAEARLWLRGFGMTGAGVDPRLSCFTPGDVLICLGNAWEDTRYGEFVALARRERGIRFAVLIYDLIPVTHPSSVNDDNALMFRRWLDGMIENADLMLAISAYSRRALLAYATERKGRLPAADVLPLGTGFRPSTRSVRAEAMAKFPSRYVLFVSTLSIRKNHQLVAKVWQALIAKHGAAKMPHLVFVGQIGWLVADFMAELRANRYLDGKIVIVSDLSDAEVRQAYDACLFTIYPSLAEGWGLPIAESFEHGKLCVASNRTSMPEVGGDLADYIDPEDLAGATAVIERAIFDEEYRRRREAQIRESYRPASWAESFSSLLAALDRLHGPDDRSTVDAVGAVGGSIRHRSRSAGADG